MWSSHRSPLYKTQTRTSSVAAPGWKIEHECRHSTLVSAQSLPESARRACTLHNASQRSCWFCGALTGLKVLLQLDELGDVGEHLCIMRTRQPYSTRWPAKVMPSLLRRMAASVTMVDDQSRDSVQGRADCQRPGACGGPAPRRREHRSQFQTEGDQNARDQPSTAFPASDAGAWTQKCKRATNAPPAHRCPQRARPPPSRQPLLVLAKIAVRFCFVGKTVIISLLLLDGGPPI